VAVTLQCRGEERQPTLMGSMTCYRALPDSVVVITQMAKAAKLSRARTPARLYSEDTLLRGLSHHRHCACRRILVGALLNHASHERL